MSSYLWTRTLREIYDKAVQLYKEGNQHRVTITTVTEADTLPPKPESLSGIPWLPRIIKKAQCFLEGGLCHEIMYCCAGDRRFLKEHDLHPADFLRIVWASDGDQKKILSYFRKTEA